MIVKAYTNQQLADGYGIPYRAWLKWLKRFRKKHPDIQQPIGGFWQPNEVQLMHDDIGPFVKEMKEDL